MNNNKIPSQNRTQQNKKAPTKKRNSDNRQMMLYRALAYLISLSVITVIAIICISCSHNYTAPSETKDNITVDSSTDRIDKNADITHYLVGDTIYINFTKLALECDMVITGSDSQQTFTVKHDNENETLKVTVDSDTAVVNGVEVQMQSKAILRENDLWLSANFVKNTVSGVTVDFDAEKNTLTIKRNELNASTPANPKYEPVYFKHNVAKPSDPVTDPEKPPVVTPSYDFKLDLSEYEQYMDPENRDDYLTLANKENYLDKDFVPDDLTLIYKASSSNAKYKMVYNAAMAFEAMVKEAAANGYNIKPLSGYRSYNTQKSTFQNWLNTEINNAKRDDPTLSDSEAYDIGYSVASMYSAPAGASEHQLGLAIDVNVLEEYFGNTPEGKWLAENCYKFGFVLRYPENKTDITGYIYEPWHFRYVGRYHAEQMTELGMVLEEYVEYLDQQ